MTREELFNWLSTCPSEQMHFNCDGKYIVTVTFHCDRDKREVHKNKGALGYECK